MERPLDALAEGTKLAGYVLGRVLGRGSFGITYLATDDLFPDRRFAIKEFFPAGLATRKAGEHTLHPTGPSQAKEFRNELASFRREALTLKELSHPNVVDVQRYVEANGTAYMVMKYEQGGSLSEALDSGPLSEEEIRELLPPLLDGLEAVHAKNFIHRDLKPANIYLRRDGSPVLIDFGAAREAMGEDRQASLSEIVTPGYAPLEQYDRHAPQGPYTDIYALGATLYRCMTDRAPLEAITRHNAIRRGQPDPLVPVERAVPGRYSAALAEAVRRSLEIDEHKRPQTIAALRSLLAAEPTDRQTSATVAETLRPAPAAPEPGRREPRVPPPARAARRGGSARWIIVASILVIGAGAAALAVYQPWAPQTPGESTAPRAVTGALKAGSVFRDCSQCPEMVVVPAGSFLMGSKEGDEVATENESPQHLVAIAKPFAMGRFEVTFAEWDACVAARACEALDNDNGWGRGRRPVMNLSWPAAKQYVAWLSRLTGKTYRLPSEAEWEYAARAGTTTRYAWGDEDGSNRANCENCGGQWGGNQTAPVGSFPANRFGLHDMHGNVWEFVEDCANASYRGAPADSRAWLTGDCAQRMMRGGSYSNHHDVIRSARREPYPSTDPSYDIGFRVVRELD